MNRHTKDAECTPDTVGVCTICHAWHGDPCLECGGRAYHKDGCAYLAALHAAAWLVHHIGPGSEVAEVAAGKE